MIAKKIMSLNLKEPSSQEDNCWGEITKSLQKNYDRLVCLSIYEMWKNNKKQYREKVNKNLNTHGLIDFKDKGKKRTYKNELFILKYFF